LSFSPFFARISESFLQALDHLDPGRNSPFFGAGGFKGGVFVGCGKKRHLKKIKTHKRKKHRRLHRKRK
jgi:hypothetical protein